jgi:hypothetical protein
MKQAVKSFLIGTISLILTACGEESASSPEETIPNQGSPNYLNPDSAIVKGRVVILFAADSDGHISVFRNPQTQMSVTISDRTNVDADVIHMGTIRIGDLVATKLNDCGGGMIRCKKAFMRIYTEEGGQPFAVRSKQYPRPRRIGVHPNGALILESFSIDRRRQTISLADFEDTEYEIFLERNFRPALNETAVLYVEFILSH